MAFVDELTISAKAGNGGDGVVRWLHEKYREFGGPAGGNGGDGGDVYIVGVRDVHLLSKYAHMQKFKAKSGDHGGQKNKGMHGASGDDLDIALPLGSIVTNKATGAVVKINHEGERILLLKGGRGGRGNQSFKSSTNQKPEQSTPGKPGEEGEFFVEVELIADIGLIGKPNAGKSTLLNALTAARAKTGDYPFTTLEPNLGECFGFIISDIPGLIEGAADGKGLGHKFLRHIRRTRLLVHLISLENEDLMSTYTMIRDELKQFDPELVEKPEIIVLTKTDLCDDLSVIETAQKEMQKINPDVYPISFLDDPSIQQLKDVLITRIKELNDTHETT